MFRVLLSIALVINSLTFTQAKIKVNPGLSNDKCVQRIYRDCNYPTHFTDEELENVRQYLNHSFTVLADVKPDKPLCHKLLVRQDWKCLSHKQKERVVNVWKIMYKRGDIQRLADLHHMSWPAWHKSGEFVPSHRYLLKEFEKIMQSIDPGTTLPYWNPFTYGVQPERSSIWETLGHSGNYSNGYSVQDGIYSELDLVPKIKRHWSPDGTILPWLTPEFMTYLIQSSRSFLEFKIKVAGAHFIPHLNIGGYEGQYSGPGAAIDLLFYLHHCSDIEGVFLRWQFQKKEFLTPLDYNLGKFFNQIDGSIRNGNIFTDTLTGVPSVTIRETFWLGFGDYCVVPDNIIKPINNLRKGIRDPIPTAFKRFSKWILKKYFPAFLSGNYSGISHYLEDVGECNTRCEPIPKPTLMRDTQQGRLQFEAFRFDLGIDLSDRIEQGEQYYMNLWHDLNKSWYCSPYVTKY